MIAVSALCAGQAAAQVSPRSPLLDLDRDEMRNQITSRYDAAVQATLSPEIKRSEDSRYIWASETKVQCGIALGYLKSGTVDAESINKCDNFFGRMNQVAPPTTPPTPPAPTCGFDPNVLVFFDWNVDAPPAEAAATIQQMADSRVNCGWTRLTVTGHADTSGSDQYNVGISTRRAENVAAMLERAGIARGDMTVSARGETELKVATADGVREPQNRRVEISASGQ